MYEDEFRAFEEADRLHPPPANPILFYGSSSIRLWNTLQEDFPGLPIINRAFGGSELRECVEHMDRWVLAYNPRAVVLYAGDNDLAHGRKPSDVLVSFREFVSRFCHALPGRPLTFISIKASPSRMNLVRAIREANAFIRNEISLWPGVRYVNIFDAMLDGAGQPRRGFFCEDWLHLSPEGYKLWRSKLQPTGAEFLLTDSKNGLNGNPITSTSMNREYHIWRSPNCQRDMDLLVFGHAGARVLVFPTRAAKMDEYERGGMVDMLRTHIENGWIQLFCVSSYDAESLYCYWKHPAERIRCHNNYERYIIDEVLPFTRRKNPNAFLIVHGCSLGAYHAVNIAFRHPDKFGRVVAFSGRYDLTSNVDDFNSLFDGYYDQNIYYNNPSHYIPNLSDESILQKLRSLSIILVIGREDPFIANNQHLSQHLWNKNVRHDLHVWDGRAHSFRDWRLMAPKYI
jgi:esterase/lipase superfamily enzyme